MEFKDLKYFGYTESGKNTGDPNIFKINLESIKNGNLIDLKHKEYIENEKKKFNKSNELSNKIEIYQSKIRAIQKDIDDLKKDKLNLLNKYNFSFLKFSLLLLFLLLLTIYLYVFYSVVIYNSFFSDENNNQTFTDSIFPSTEIIFYAFSNLWSILAPLVFIAFAVVLHLIIENKQLGKIRYLYCAIVITLTLLLDVFLSYKIRSKEIIYKQFMGEEVEPFYKDISFYIIILMGFIVFILWSIIFHNLLNEYKKRNPGIIIEEKIKQNENEIKIIQNKIIEIKQYSTFVSLINDDIKRDSMIKFTQGWFLFLKGLEELSPILKKCNDIYEDHKI